MHWGDSFILHMLSVAWGVICSRTGRTRDISVRVRVGGVEGDSPICFSDFCQAADMAVPLGSSPWESPSWKGGHFCLGACGPQPDLSPTPPPPPARYFPGANGARSRDVPTGLLPCIVPSDRRGSGQALCSPSTQGLALSCIPKTASPRLHAGCKHPSEPPGKWARPRPPPLLKGLKDPHLAPRTQGAASCPPAGASVHPPAEGIARSPAVTDPGSPPPGSSTCQVWARKRKSSARGSGAPLGGELQRGSGRHLGSVRGAPGGR